MKNFPKRLKFENFNNIDNTLLIDLHNGYSVIALICRKEENVYTTTLFLKENTIDNWMLIDKAERLEFCIKPKTNINSVILKIVGNFLSEKFFDYYIKRYEYELKCFEEGSKYIKFEAENA